MSATKFSMARDVNGFNGFGIPFSQNGETMVLAVATEQHITVPSDYPNWIAVFGYTPGATVWVDGITTAVAPTGAASASTARLNPTARSVKAGQTLSFITSDSTSPMVCVEYFVVNPYVN